MTNRARGDWRQLTLDGAPAVVDAPRTKARAAQLDELAAAWSAERFRELHGARKPRPPRPPVSEAAAAADRAAVVVDVRALLRAGAEAGRFGLPAPPTGSIAAELVSSGRGALFGALMAAYDAAPVDDDRPRRPRPREGYADAKAERHARQAAALRELIPPDPLSVHRPVTLQGDGKALDRRYLAGVVRAAIRPLMPRRGGLRVCGERTQPGQGVAVSLRRVDQGGAVGHRAGVAGVVRCGSRCCPTCAPRVSVGWAKVLRVVVGAHRAETRSDDAPAGGVELATLTLPHTRALALDDAHELRQQSWRRVQTRAAWRQLKAELGIVGTVTAREQPHGANGWHAHIHVLLATSRAWSPDERATFRHRLFELWSRAALDVAAERGVDMAAPLYRYVDPVTGAESFPAVDVRPSHDDDYLAKMGLADELTGAIFKRGRAGSRTYFEIAADYAREPSRSDAGLIRDYVDVMRGTRALTWSQGRTLFPVARELRGTKRRVAVAMQQAATVAALSLDELRALLRRSPDLRVRYLPELVEHVGAELPYDLLRAYGPVVRALVERLAPEQTDLGFLTDRERLERDDRAGQVVASLPSRQFVALARVLRPVRGDASYEIAAAVELATREGLSAGDGVRAMLAAAYQLGRRLRRGRKLRRLDRWLGYLKPADDDAHVAGAGDALSAYRLTTPRRVPAYARQ